MTIKTGSTAQHSTTGQLQWLTLLGLALGITDNKQFSSLSTPDNVGTTTLLPIFISTLGSTRHTSISYMVRLVSQDWPWQEAPLVHSCKVQTTLTKELRISEPPFTQSCKLTDIVSSRSRSDILPITSVQRTLGDGSVPVCGRS
jgi:hypothetical protein